MELQHCSQQSVEYEQTSIWECLKQESGINEQNEREIIIYSSFLFKTKLLMTVQQKPLVCSESLMEL